jgi:DNA-binding GntR family transcriptional regulator
MRIHRLDADDAPSAANRTFESLRRAVIPGALKDGEPLRLQELAGDLHG